MACVINWSAKAKKQLSKIDRQHQGKIIDAVDDLAFFPDVKDVLPLTNHQYGYRMRVGNYRVLFDADSTVKIIEIRQVRKRDERTY